MILLVLGFVLSLVTGFTFVLTLVYYLRNMREEHEAMEQIIQRQIDINRMNQQTNHYVIENAERA